MGRPRGDADAGGESADVDATPPADAALPPLVDIDSGAEYASQRHPPAIETTLARLALKETPRSPRSPARRPPPDAAVLVLGFPDSLPPSSSAVAAAVNQHTDSAPSSPSRPLQRSGSGALFASLQASASSAPPAEAAAHPPGVAASTPESVAAPADSPRGALGTLSLSRGAVAVAVPVPSWHTPPGAAVPEQATPPSPSPLSPLWTRASGSGSSGPGLAAARRASPEGVTALPRALFGSVERSFLTGRMQLKPAGGSHVRLPGFHAVLAVRATSSASSRNAPAKRRLPFAAESCAAGPFQELHAPPPFAAAIALDGSGVSGGTAGERIRLPMSGEVVLVLSNPEGTPLHTFRVPYDFLSLLPTHPGAPAMRAYLRQRVVAVLKPRAATSAPSFAGGFGGSSASGGTPRYVVQLRFVSPAVRGAPTQCEPVGNAAESITALGSPQHSNGGPATPQPGSASSRRLYLQGDIRVVFPLRRHDDDDATQLRAETEPAVLEAMHVVAGRAAGVSL